MKKGWEIKTLGEVCKVERGSSPRPIKNFTTLESDGVNWIKIGDTKDVNKYIYSTAEKITKEGALKSRHVKEGDFILSNSMSLGKPFIMKTDGCVHDGWFILKLPEYINSDYFYHLLTSEEVQNQFKDLAAGAIVKNISGDLVKKTILPIPPIKEQEEIVERLDKGFELIDSLKETAKKNLDNAKELFQSVLREELSPKEGWETKTLGEVCEVISGQSPEGKYYNNEGVGLPFYQGKKEFQEKYIGEPTTWTSVTTKIALKDDILMSVRAPVGSINYCTQKICIGRGLAAIRTINVNKDFIYYQLLSKQNEIVGKAGAVFPSINRDEIRSIILNIPSKIQEQEEIVGRLDRIKGYCEELEGNYKRVLELCEELKQGLLREAFSY